MANGLQESAQQWTKEKPMGVLLQQSIVSLDLELGEAAWLRTAPPAPGDVAPRLKATKMKSRPGTVQLAVRESQVTFQSLYQVLACCPSIFHHNRWINFTNTHILSKMIKWKCDGENSLIYGRVECSLAS